LLPHHFPHHSFFPFTSPFSFTFQIFFLKVYKTFGDVLSIPEFYRRARGERKGIRKSNALKIALPINPTKERENPCKSVS